jgi:hypothetical protein
MMVRFVDIDGIEDYLSFHNKQSRSWRGVLDTTFMKFVSDLRHVNGFLRFPGSTNKTDRHRDIVESGVKHHNPKH